MSRPSYQGPVRTVSEVKTLSGSMSCWSNKYINKYNSLTSDKTKSTRNTKHNLVVSAIFIFIIYNGIKYVSLAYIKMFYNYITVTYIPSYLWKKNPIKITLEKLNTVLIVMLLKMILFFATICKLCINTHS